MSSTATPTMEVNPGFALAKSEVIELTPEFADSFSKMEASPTERDINPKRLSHLRNKLDNGVFVTCHWAVARMGDRTLRMNGQHSSTMLAGLNGEFPHGLKVHLDTYEVDGPDGLALLFRQFDDRRSSRTPSDVAGAYQGIYPDLKDLPKQIAKLGIEAIAWHNRYAEGVPTPGADDRYGMFGDTTTHPFLLWLGNVYSSKTPELKKVPVIAAMYATYMKEKDEANAFWHSVARGGVEFNDTAPSTVLDNFLRAAEKDNGGSRKLKPGNFYQACIFAWNAYRDEKPIASIKCDTKKGFLAVSD